MTYRFQGYYRRHPIKYLRYRLSVWRMVRDGRKHGIVIIVDEIAVWKPGLERRRPISDPDMLPFQQQRPWQAP